MSAIVDRLKGEIRGAWRYRRPALVAAYVLALVGWSVSLAVPSLYEATARVFVNTSTALKPLLQGLTVEDDVDAQLAMVREGLLGRERLERVIREADLAVHVTSPDDKDRLLEKLREQISIEALTPGTLRDANRSGNSVYAISYRHPDREKALMVVSNIVDGFMEDTLSGKRTGADAAQSFLADQVRTYEQRLSAAEERLASFKKRNVGLVPGEQGDYFSRLQAEIALSRQAASKLDIALRRRGELARQLATEQPYRVAGGTLQGAVGVPGLDAPTGGGNDTVSRIAETQTKLDELMLKFTDRHPSVIELQETLRQLKDRHAAELDALRRGDMSAAATSGLAINPVYQSLQLQLKQLDVEIAANRGELADHRTAEVELRAFVNTAPEVEAEFARLTRDYDVEKAQYTALLERLQKAKLAENAADTGIVEFTIINPPFAAADPVTPSQKLIVAGIFAASVLSALLLAWLLSRLKPVYDNARALADDTGLPVFGSVSLLWADRAAADFRRSLRAFAGAIAGLALTGVCFAVFSPVAARTLAALVRG
jgi:polysaccharide chain length determinant protein (PEP-CTERM system associated)